MPDTEEPQAQLDAAVLGRVPELTAEQAARAADVSLEDARRLWRGLGFPEVGDEAAFTLDDVGALVRVREAFEAGIDIDTLARVTRAVGRTMSRLADWEVANVLPGFEERYGSLDDAERVEKAVELVNAITPSFELLLLYTWRRHLAAAASRSGAVAGTHDEVHVMATIGFADLVSFTALSNELDDDQIGDLVEVFEARCHDVVAGRNGRIIKSIGDSVLFVSDTPEDAIDIALDLVAVIGGDQRLPDVKVGLATGPLVQRMGDVYGPAVNLAARLTGVARRNRVIIDRETAELLSPEDFETRLLPARPLRGFGEVEPLTVRRTRPRH
ncbi:MAG: adenylate/guanylate cyclase domain-containing protein [Marmoricola sp.]